MNRNSFLRQASLTAVVFALQASIAWSDIETGLTGHWKLDETSVDTLVDSTGNSSGGVIHNSAGNLGRPGVLGTSFQFDGATSTHKVDTNTKTAIPASGEMSIFAWIKTGVTPAVPGAGAYIMNNHLGSLSGRSLLAVDQSGQVCFFREGQSVYSADTVTDDRWHHVGVTRSDAGSIQIWIDGAPNGSPENITGGIAQTEQNWFIGGREADDARNFEGLIDDVRTYNRELSASDVAELYAARFLTDWEFFKDLLIDPSKVMGDLVDFPLLVSLPSDADLAANAVDGIPNLAFGAADGNTFFAHEIEQFDAMTGALRAWVRVPLLNGDSETTVRLFFGGKHDFQDPAGVWRDLYEAVWHMDDDLAAPQPNILSSTGSGRHATSYVLAPEDRLAGQIGDAIRFQSASSPYIRALDYPGPTGAFTASLWFRVDNITQQQRFIGNHQGTTGTANFWVEVANSQLYGGVGIQGSAALLEYGGAPSSATWHLAHLVFDGDKTLRGYLDGEPVFAKVHTTAISYTNPGRDIHIGKMASHDDRYVNGILDEIRLSSLILAPEWIKTEHNNQSDPASFYSLGKAHLVFPRGTTILLR